MALVNLTTMKTTSNNNTKKRTCWTDADTAVFMKHYPDSTVHELYALFAGRYTFKELGNKRRHMNIHKSDAFRKKYGLSPDGRIQPGNIPPNKGKPFDAGIRSRQTQFKSGNKPANHKPVGSTRITRDGYIEIKIAEGIHKWRLLHREIWKQHHGEYPKKGHALIFIDGNKQNCDIGNLKLVTRQELMQMNTVHNLPKPIVQLIQLNGVVRRKINDTQKRRKRTA